MSEKMRMYNLVVYVLYFITFVLLFGTIGSLIDYFRAYDSYRASILPAFLCFGGAVFSASLSIIVEAAIMYIENNILDSDIKSKDSE